MRNFPCLVFAALSFCGGSLFAQSPNAGAKGAAADAASPAAGKTATDAWNELLVLAKPVPVAKSKGGKARSEAEITADVRQQKATLRQAAQAARLFYLQNPGDLRAMEARKIEALATLRAVEYGDTAQEQAAETLARTYRNHPAFPAVDRLEIAIAEERLRLSQRIRRKTAQDRPAEWLTIGDALRAEFGDAAALQDYYITVARKSDLATAADIAKKVLQSTAASKEAKTEAQDIMDRAALIGKPLTIGLPLAGSKKLLDLTHARGKPLVLVMWSPADIGSLDVIRPFRQAFMTQVQLVYVAIGGTAKDVNSARIAMPFPGFYCHFQAGEAATAAIKALHLERSRPPNVYLVDRTGNVAAIGAVRELPELLKKVRPAPRSSGDE